MEYGIWIDGLNAFKHTIDEYSPLAYDYNLSRTESHSFINNLGKKIHSNYDNFLVICKNRFIYFENSTNYVLLHTTGDYTVIMPKQNLIDEGVFISKLSNRVSNKLENILFDNKPIDETANMLIRNFDEYINSYKCSIDSMSDSLFMSRYNKSSLSRI